MRVRCCHRRVPRAMLTPRRARTTRHRRAQRMAISNAAGLAPGVERPLEARADRRGRPLDAQAHGQCGEAAARPARPAPASLGTGRCPRAYNASAYRDWWPTTSPRCRLRTSTVAEADVVTTVLACGGAGPLAPAARRAAPRHPQRRRCDAPTSANAGRSAHGLHRLVGELGAGCGSADRSTPSSFDWPSSPTRTWKTTAGRSTIGQQACCALSASTGGYSPALPSGGYCGDAALPTLLDRRGSLRRRTRPTSAMA